jgi:hypothetical protein
MATRTKSSPKPKPDPAPKAKGKPPRSVWAKGGQKKPTNALEWVGYHLSKRADKYALTRGVRGLHRKGLAQAERARERKQARKEHRHSAHPTWGERRTQRKFDQQANSGGGKATVACIGCGANLNTEAARTHHCPTDAAETKRIEAARDKWRARAGYGGPTATAPAASSAAAQLAAPPIDHREAIKQWKWDRKAWRRENMTRPARAWDTVQRYDSVFAGNGAKCGACGIAVHGDEWDTHDCGNTPYTHPRYQQAPVTPTPAPTPQPSTSSTPAATNGGRPPVAFGKGSSSSNGAGTATGSGASSQHAAAVLQAMAAWSQDIPNTEGEMMGMLAAMNNMCVGMGGFVREFQARLINMGTDAEGHPIGFHPSCVAQLNGAADQIAGAGAYFTATGVAIQQYYEPLKQFLQGGAPAPKRSYFAS